LNTLKPGDAFQWPPDWTKQRLYILQPKSPAKRPDTPENVEDARTADNMARHAFQRDTPVIARPDACIVFEDQPCVNELRAVITRAWQALQHEDRSAEARIVAVAAILAPYIEDKND
jgi:hypothetical protein